ncbi:MAG TPA: decarboxylase [Gammaproteobacteria bacterium]|jgi:sulfopyruvate decarboxylase subunit alpha|nr:decarboxylase [Gammaproteobacteria bacterium]HBP85309.1 decarboxylase [Gammaproteobacteria bacterium]HCL94625.1 decarboxylase [Gammaproteobacteria bacterium]|tara:strand:- start:355 stop:879 length:525 start_codon:yes stop_codon:yes gene_type:complete
MGEPLRGMNIQAALHEAHVEFVVALPDIVTCDELLWPIARESNFRLVNVCKEDEGVSICAGLSYAGKRAILLMQHTGFLDSINAIRVMGMDYQLPIVMMIGLQGLEEDRSPSESAQNGVRIVEPILKAMDIRYLVLNDDSDSSAISKAIDSAYSAPQPLVFLIPRMGKPDDYEA